MVSGLNDMLTDASESMRLRCIDQLYDDWRGYYVLRHLSAGCWIDDRPLSRDEAVKMKHLGKDEALLIVCSKRVT